MHRQIYGSQRSCSSNTLLSIPLRQPGNNAGYYATEAAPNDAEAVPSNTLATPSDKQPIDIEPIAVPSLQLGGLKEITDNFGNNAGYYATKAAPCNILAISNYGFQFTLKEIMDGTNKFDNNLLLGVGESALVYKGILEDGTNVAVKRADLRFKQGLAKFHNVIEMSSKLRHPHLVSFIGYSYQESEIIHVYECMANGTLRSHLYGTNLPPLSWKQRLEICIGAARGLHYLHAGVAHSIIHRDIKTTHILLDENFVAKVANLGLSISGPAIDQTHVSTVVKGTFGYLDPEYFRRQELTEKSDVYSFGVVLMEVLCARPPIKPPLPREQVNIVEWAMMWQKKGMLDQIMDPNLVGKVNPDSLKMFGVTAEKCLANHGVDRPSMGDVLGNLEFALQLEEISAGQRD